MTYLSDQELERELRALGDAAPPDGVQERLATAVAEAAAVARRQRPNGSKRWWPRVALGAALIMIGAVIAAQTIGAPDQHASARRTGGFTLVDLRWQRGPALPRPRLSAAVVSVGGRVYVLGGRSLDGGASVARSVYAINPHSVRWHPVANLPQPRAGASAVAAGGKIYVVGGDLYPSRGGLVVQPMLVFSPTTDSWSTVGVPGPPRVDPAIAVETLNGHPTVFIFGGLGPNGAPAPNLAYDAVTGRFTNLPGSPTWFTDTTAVAVRGMIYLFGSTNAEGLEQPTVYQYAPATGTFTPKMPIPHPITGVTWMPGSGTAIAGRVILAGDDGRGRRVDVYDPTTNAWASLPNLAAAQPGGSIAAIGDTLYVVGGFKLIDGGNAIVGIRTVETLTVQPHRH